MAVVHKSHMAVVHMRRVWSYVTSTWPSLEEKQSLSADWPAWKYVTPFFVSVTKPSCYLLWHHRYPDLFSPVHSSPSLLLHAHSRLLSGSVLSLLGSFPLSLLCLSLSGLGEKLRNKRRGCSQPGMSQCSWSCRSHAPGTLSLPLSPSHLCQNCFCWAQC